MKLNQNQQKSIRKIAKKYHLTLMLVFGSQAAGKTHPESDLDIAVLAKKNDFSFDKQASLSLDLLNIFPDQEIDLVLINRANPLLLQKINENCLKLHGRDRDFMKFKLYAFNKFQDYKPYFELERMATEKFIKEL